jgi:hypothetical protein
MFWQNSFQNNNKKSSKIKMGYNQKSEIEEGLGKQWLKAKMTEGLTMIYKTLHRKLTIEQHKPH